MSRFFARLALSIAALLVMIVASLFATGFFALALYQFLDEFMSEALAALLTGILILIFASIIVAVTLAGSWKKREIEPEPIRVARDTLAEFGGDLGKKLAAHLDSNKPGVLIAALVAGVIVGVSPKLRRFLLDILKNR